MSIDRRQFFTAMAGVTAMAGASGSAIRQASAEDSPFSLADLRGTANANDLGLKSGIIDDQSRQLQTILNQAAEADKPVFLPPGNYFVSNIILPSRTRLMGVPGASRLVYTGSGHFLIAENAAHIELTGIVIDAANRGMHSYAEAAVRLSDVDHAVIDNCMVLGSLETGIRIERSKGRIERSKVTGAAGDCGIYGLENKGLLITNNEVSDCVNGGILVHRWQNGEDDTIVTNNRISNINAGNGGTGQWGNGINVFRAANVMIANNHISDCLFSAIRSNAGNNVQITGNTCLRSGETAIYSEFEFNGALISSNIVDGGAQGISITNFMQDGRLAVCSGNLVRNIVRTAPYIDPDHLFGGGISVEADTTVTGNVIEDAEAFGIMLGWGPYLRDVIATSNVIRGSETGIYVSVVDGIGPTHIADNTIAGASKGAIVGYHWKEAVTGDLSGNAETGVTNLTVERNRVS